MTHFSKLSMAASMALGALSLPASAHVSYIDLSDTVTSPGGVNGSSFSNFGWYLGTTATLGDSHELAGGDFFKFHLDQASLVTLSFSDVSGTGLLNPAFSLYSGLLPDEGHDDAAIDPLNPKASTAPFGKIASPVDNGTTADAYGRVSPFRDTANVTYVGQFDALHSWSLGNESGDWSVIQYLTHVDPSGGTTASLLGYYLAAGDYTIAASGGYSGVDQLTGLAGTFSFSATPVPEPGAWWMLAAGIATLGGLTVRRNK